MQRINQSKLLQRYQGKDISPDLNKALRRAAAFGSKADVETLILLGADVKSVGSRTGRTALHWAVVKNNANNIPLLMQHNASLHTKDRFGKTPAQYAAQSKFETVRQYGQNLNQYLVYSGVANNLVRYLDFKSSMHLLTQCMSWSVLVANHRLQLMHAYGEGVKDIVMAIPLPLRRSILERLYLHDERTTELLSLYFRLLQQPVEKRKELYAEQTGKSLPQNLLSKSMNNVVCFLLVFEKLTPEDIVTKSELVNPYAARMLDENVFKVEDYPKFKNQRAHSSTSNNLASLMSTGGLTLLREGLLSVEDASAIQNLRSVCTEAGINLLRRSIISARLLVEISKNASSFDMNGITKDGVIKLFDTGLVTFNVFDPGVKEHVLMAIQLYSHIDALLSGELLELLRQRRINLFQLASILRHLANSNNTYHGSKYDNSKTTILCSLIADGVIPVDQFHKIARFEIFLSVFAVNALMEGLLTWQQLADHPELAKLLCENGLKLLREGFLTVKDAVEIAGFAPKNITTAHHGANNLVYLMLDSGYEAVTSGAVSIDDAKKYSLAILQHKNAVIALSEKLITLQQASLFHCYGGVFQARSLSVLLDNLDVLREKLITPEEAALFYHSGSTHGSHDDLGKLMTPAGKEVLKHKVLPLAIAACLYNLDSLLGAINPDVIAALKFGLIDLNDFEYAPYGVKRSYTTKYPGVTDLAEVAKRLVADHVSQALVADNYPMSVKVEKAIKIQSHFRMHIARQKYGFFRHVSDLLKSGAVNISNMKIVSDALSLAEEGRVHKASEQLTKAGFIHLPMRGSTK